MYESYHDYRCQPMCVFEMQLFEIGDCLETNIFPICLSYIVLLSGMRYHALKS